MFWKKLFNIDSHGQKTSGATKYVGKDATVILDAKGRVLTTWANSEAGFRSPIAINEKLTKLTGSEKTLLQDCLRKYELNLLEKMPLIETGTLDDSTINEMREAVGTELLNHGFKSDGEPNEYGLKLEELIDVLSHYWKSLRNRLSTK